MLQLQFILGDSSRKREYRLRSRPHTGRNGGQLRPSNRKPTMLTKFGRLCTVASTGLSTKPGSGPDCLLQPNRASPQTECNAIAERFSARFSRVVLAAAVDIGLPNPMA